jgi:hypothetical protein
MTKFNHCPNPECERKPAGGFFGASVMTIYECKKCDTLYCPLCGDMRCPECGSRDRREAGKCFAKR